MMARTEFTRNYLLGGIKLLLFRTLDGCRVLPLSWRYLITDLCAVIAVGLMRKSRLAVRKNLLLILGRTASSREVVRVFTEYGRYWAELADLNSYWDGAQCEFLGDFPPRESSFIGLTFHIGNFEVFGRALSDIVGGDFCVVAERLRPGFLASYFRDKRARYHMETIPHDDVRALLSRLKKRHPVGIVCDRMIAGIGVPTRIFGIPVRLPLNIIEIAHRERIPIYVAYCVKDHRSLKIIGRRFDPSQAVDGIVSGVARVLEDAVRRHPFQWHVLSDINTA